MSDQPEIFVACAALCERGDQLLVMQSHANDPSEGEENAAERRLTCGHEVLNQPVGRLRLGETVIQAVERIVREQVNLEVQPVHLIGPYCWLLRNGYTIIRYNFVCSFVDPSAEPKSSDPELTAIWLNAKELDQHRGKFRNPATRQAFDDYVARRFRPLSEAMLMTCWD